MDRAGRDAYDDQGVRDVRDVLPRLSDRPDATAPRVNRVFDAVDAAHSLLPPHAHYAQQPQQPQQSHQQLQGSQGPQQLRQLQPPLSAPALFQNSGSSRHYFQQYHQHQDCRPNAYRPQHNPSASNSDSQDTVSSTDTAASTDTDRLFTPPISDGGLSVGAGGSVSANGNGSGSGSESGSAYGYEHDFSSQESQLLQLSELAAASARMADVNAPDALDTSALSRKRTADGGVKHTRSMSNTSSVFTGGHSRNTSTVSVASTTGSRIGELSAELKAKLSYAMVKVNNGWQAHSIDQVENFASQATSPASSTSTIHGRHGPSSSPRPSGVPHKRRLSQASQISHASASTASTAMGPGRTLAAIDTSGWLSHSAARSYNNTSPLLASPLAVSRSSDSGATRSLAPPVSIQPSRPGLSARRNSNPGLGHINIPPFSHHASPPTPGYPSPVKRTPTVDPILFSPHQNVREQDAIETLLFMSSPGNSVNMKHFPSSSSQPLPNEHQHHESHSLQYQQLLPTGGSPQRHALPSAPRKSLPSSRPPSHRHSQSLSSRRGHNRSPSEMEMDESFGTPPSSSAVRATPRRPGNGYQTADAPTPRLKMPLSMPSGLSGTSRPRPALGEDDIEKMLDRAAAASAADESSDSDSEILIPVRRTGQVGI